MIEIEKKRITGERHIKFTAFDNEYDQRITFDYIISAPTDDEETVIDEVLNVLSLNIAEADYHVSPEMRESMENEILTEITERFGV